LVKINHLALFNYIILALLKPSLLATLTALLFLESATFNETIIFILGGNYDY